MRRPLVLASLAACLALAPVVRADWPVARHDAQRTATAPGSSTITKPAVYWQLYLGGSLDDRSHLALDVNGDGTTEVVYLAGGKAIAKLPDDALVWESPPVDLIAIDGVSDVDGDGTLEVIANSATGAVLISGKTGQIKWTEPAGEVGNVGGVRVGDLDGDGKADVLVDDCACCGVSATSATPGAVYSFAGGNPKLLWSPAPRAHCGGSAVTLGDWDGNGVLDVAYADDGTMILADGKTGAVLDASTSFTQRLYYGTCDTANIDGRPGDELVCYEDTYYASGMAGGHGIGVATYDPTATPKVRLLWDVLTADKVNGRLLYGGTSLGDFDKDGKWEIAASLYDGGAWNTNVYDAVSGTVLGTMPNRQLAGVADIDGAGNKSILTYAPSGQALEAWSFARAVSPTTSLKWTLGGGNALLSQVDWGKVLRNATVAGPVLVDTGAGSIQPVVANGGASLVALKAAGTQTPTPLATFAIPQGITLLTHQVFAKVNRTYDQLLVTRNDGFLVVLDNQLAPTNFFMGTSEEDSRPGMRVGGYTAAPIAANLGTPGDAIVVTDSRGTLQRLDATAAWMIQPPATVWSLAGASNPVTAPKLDGGKTAFVCNQGSALTSLTAAGAKIWSIPVGGSIAFDPVPAGDVNGDGVPDVFAEYSTAGSVGNYQAYDGKTGAAIWSTPHSEAIQWGLEPFSVYDYDGDGISDLWTVLNTLRILGGPTGTKIQENTTFLAYFTPVVSDVDFDGVVEATMSQGYYPARTFKHDLVTALWTGPDDRPYSHGARAVCSGQQSVWVQPSTQTPGLLRLVLMNGTQVGQTTSLYLAGGKIWTSASSVQGYLGNLRNVTVKADLLGTKDHPSALVPSSDGWLYALDPCKAALDWSYDMHFPPGEAVFADTSGDGVDEIIVTAADGYLYALSQQLLDAPAWVHDTDPANPSSTQDLADLTTANSLRAAWAPVAGADAYQLAVVTAGGSYVTQPDWIDVGNVTAATTSNLSLVDKTQYFQLIRAVSKTKGSSPQTSSDGVIVHLSSGVLDNPDGGLVDASADGGDAGNGAAADFGHASSGCGCRQAPRAPAWPGVVAACLALLFVRVRRRARGACRDGRRGAGRGSDAAPRRLRRDRHGPARDPADRA